MAKKTVDDDGNNVRIDRMSDISPTRSKSYPSPIPIRLWLVSTDHKVIRGQNFGEKSVGLELTAIRRDL